MADRTTGRILVEATIENLADLYAARRGRIAASEVRRVEVTDAVVYPNMFGLLMPLGLVEQLGLEPVATRTSDEYFAAGRPTGFPRPILYSAVCLTIQGRDCVMDVGAIADHQSVAIGLIALGSMDWVIDAESGRLIGTPEHGGEEMDYLFHLELTTVARLDPP